MKVREALFSGILAGCSDHNCIVTGKQKGMGTNGGCHCLQNASRAQLALISSRAMVFGESDIQANQTKEDE